MKKVLLISAIAITLTGCTVPNADYSNSSGTEKVKFTMPNRQIEDIQEPADKPQSSNVLQTEEDSLTENNKNTSKRFFRVSYIPMSKEECINSMDTLGLKYCSGNNDHLAGVAKACGHINNIPSGDDLHHLAQQIYHTNTSDTSIYGNRDDKILNEMGIYANDSHIFYWAREEAKDGTRGFVRMFASKGTIPYYADRDGSAYYTSNGYNRVMYGQTRHISLVNSDHDSNLSGLPNNDVLMAICYK